ncbi:MAG: hypothetical protein K2P64_00930, partial [Lachnospiraceae bacterium]|nr:hypothetical protein [Lachnospiraceae bacterium]
LVTGEDEEHVKALAQELAKLAGEEEGAVTVLGPCPASYSKLNDNYRFIFYMKSVDEKKLAEARERMENHIQTLQKRAEQVQFDIDPMNGY